MNELFNKDVETKFFENCVDKFIASEYTNEKNTNHFDLGQTGEGLPVVKTSLCSLLG